MTSLATALLSTFFCWLIWESISATMSFPVHADTGEPLRPPISVYQCWLARRVRADRGQQR